LVRKPVDVENGEEESIKKKKNFGRKSGQRRNTVRGGGSVLPRHRNFHRKMWGGKKQKRETNFRVGKGLGYSKIAGQQGGGY